MAVSVTRYIVAFGSALRGAGLEVGPARVADALRALDAVGLERREDVYWCLRQTLVSGVDDFEEFDRVFDAWFSRPGSRVPSHRSRELSPPVDRQGGVFERDQDDSREGAQSGGWSSVEALRTRDFATMSAEEFEQARRLIARIATLRPRRRSRRSRPHSRGRTLDLRRLVRASLATGGDPVVRPFRRRLKTPRRVVVILDVSASMSAYARAMLLYMHAVRGSGRGVEAFAFGTRLTRLTQELGSRKADDALGIAAARVVDWSGGTRIGASLKAYNDQFGRRALTRGAVVVIFSDGWERDDPVLLRGRWHA